MKKLYVSKSGYAPLRDKPATGKKVLDVPQFARVVQETDEVIVVNGDRFLDVSYYAKGGKRGWMYAGYLDEYIEKYPYPVQIDSQTIDDNDAEQYVIWKNQVQYNLCGELCVLYCTGWDLSATEFLDALHKASSSNRFKEFFLRTFPQFRSRGTGPADLNTMLSLYDDYQPGRSLELALYDHNAGRSIYSAGRIAKILETNNIIAGCKTDVISGRLRGQGAGHWVTLESIELNRTGGIVHLFNPMVGMEDYSWQEWIATAPQPYGILVNRR